ncbi:MAG TPA: PIG-L family deacetylase [Tepidisphaeraceae bacterium]|nr:PIG-L family deacetylase [Tepidisphaeraceae bacterium]
MSQVESIDILAFGAHPDDIEFGCGGVIARETRAGLTAHFAICSKGEAGTHGTPAIRTAEAEQSAALLGATVEFIELDGDAHLQERIEHTIRLASIIRQTKAKIILAPSLVENQHPDHWRLGKLVRDATRLARFGGLKELRELPSHSIDLLLYYAVAPQAEPRDGLSILIDISDQQILSAWQNAMEAHASQSATRDYVELQMTRARLAGLNAGLGHAIALYPNDPILVDSITTLGPSARKF